MENRAQDVMPPVEQRYPENQWLIKGAFVTALVTGFGGAVSKVWDMFYGNFKDRGPVAALRQTHKNNMDEILAKAANSPMSRADFVRECATEEKRFGKAFNAFLKKSVGIESEGLGAITGTWHRFDSLGPYTKAKIAFSTVFTTAAAIGGYMLINQNAHMKRDLLSMQDRLEQDRQRAHSDKPQR